MNICSSLSTCVDLGQSVRGKWRNIYTFIVSQTGEKSRDDALEAIKGNLDGFSRDAKMHPTPASHPKKPGSFNFNFLLMEDDWNPCIFNWCVCCGGGGGSECWILPSS